MAEKGCLRSSLCFSAWAFAWQAAAARSLLPTINGSVMGHSSVAIMMNVQASMLTLLALLSLRKALITRVAVALAAIQ